MGTDIHMIAEVRKNGNWECVNTDMGISRNYRLFSILAGVRGDERVTPISPPKGYPADMSDSMDYMGLEHSASYLTLKELHEYDWSQPYKEVGIITLDQYEECRSGPYDIPCNWCGSIMGNNIKVVSEEVAKALLDGVVEPAPNIRYHVRYHFPSKPYSFWCEDFLKKSMPVLEGYQEQGILPENIRIVFDFDS